MSSQNQFSNNSNGGCLNTTSLILGSVASIVTILLFCGITGPAGFFNRSQTSPTPSTSSSNIQGSNLTLVADTQITLPIPTADTQPTINGVWVGEFVSNGNVLYEYRLEIGQNASEIIGTAQTTRLSNPELLVITKVRGTFESSMLHFEEYEITQDSTGVACFISGALTYYNFPQQETLSGLWQGRPGINNCPGSGTLYLQKYEQ